MNKRLFVAGLPFSATEEDLKNLFLDIGNVVTATVIIDRDSGKSKGFGFVEMQTPEEAEGAIAKLNGSEFGGRKLVVNEARPQEERPKRDVRYGGGFGNRRQSFGKRREGGRNNFGRNGENSGRGGFSGGRY